MRKRERCNSIWNWGHVFELRGVHIAGKNIFAEGNPFSARYFPRNKVSQRLFFSVEVLTEKTLWLSSKWRSYSVCCLLREISDRASHFSPETDQFFLNFFLGPSRHAITQLLIEVNFKKVSANEVDGRKFIFSVRKKRTAF